MNKVARNAREAIADLQDGATIMAGGFGVCGVPEDLLNATCEKGVNDLTVISNNAGIDGLGVGLLLASRQVRKMISTYVGENQLFEKLALAGADNLIGTVWGRGYMIREPAEDAAVTLPMAPSQLAMRTVAA